MTRPFMGWLMRWWSLFSGDNGVGLAEWWSLFSGDNGAGLMGWWSLFSGDNGVDLAKGWSLFSGDNGAGLAGWRGLLSRGRWVWYKLAECVRGSDDSWCDTWLGVSGWQQARYGGVSKQATSVLSEGGPWEGLMLARPSSLPPSLPPHSTSHLTVSIPAVMHASE